MSESFIGEYEHKNFFGKISYDDPTLTEEQIRGICDYLDGKKYNDNGRIVENVLDDFLYHIVRKPSKDPHYRDEVLNFIRSKYFSDRVKKDIYKLSSTLKGHTRLNKMLLSELHMNDFDKDALCDVLNVFDEYMKRGRIDKDINPEINLTFIHYMFALDGVGPYEHIKSEYTDKELAKAIVTNIGLAPEPSYYSGLGISLLDLNQEHLIAIYEQYEKFFPNKKDEFVKLVRKTEMFTPTEFLTNYFRFVENGFSCHGLKLKKGDFSVDGLHGELRDLVGFASVKKHDDITEEGRKALTTLEELTNEGIRKGFNDYLNKKKKELKMETK